MHGGGALNIMEALLVKPFSSSYPHLFYLHIISEAAASQSKKKVAMESFKKGKLETRKGQKCDTLTCGAQDPGYGWGGRAAAEAWGRGRGPEVQPTWSCRVPSEGAFAHCALTGHLGGQQLWLLSGYVFPDVALGQ